MFRHLSLDEMLHLHYLLGKIEGACMVGHSNRYEADTVALSFEGIIKTVADMAHLIRIRIDDSDTRITSVDSGDETADRETEPTLAGDGGETQ